MVITVAKVTDHNWTARRGTLIGRGSSPSAAMDDLFRLIALRERS